MTVSTPLQSSRNSKTVVFTEFSLSLLLLSIVTNNGKANNGKATQPWNATQLWTDLRITKAILHDV
ncbi:MAG: hypothetical protein WAM42_02460 [Candidatus Nitrosopolaris sp.]